MAYYNYREMSDKEKLIQVLYDLRLDCYLEAHGMRDQFKNHLAHAQEALIGYTAYNDSEIKDAIRMITRAEQLLIEARQRLVVRDGKNGALAQSGAQSEYCGIDEIDQSLDGYTKLAPQL